MVTPKEASTESAPLNAWQCGKPLLSHQMQQKQHHQQQPQKQLQQLQRGGRGGSGSEGVAPVASAWGSLQQESQRQRQGVVDAAQAANRSNLKVGWDGTTYCILLFGAVIV